MATALPLPAGLPLDAASWEQTPPVVRLLIIHLLAVVERPEARIAALEARPSQHPPTLIVPPHPILRL
jgi:hypothetical protein